MLHEQRSTLHGIFKRNNLLVQQLAFGGAGLPGGKGIVHLAARIEQRLLEGQRSLFLLGLGYLELGGELPAGKERLGKRTYRRCQEFAGVDNHRTRRIGPSGTAAQGNGRIESRAGGIGNVESSLQGPFGRADIGTGGKHLYRNSDGKVGRELLSFEHPAFVVAGRFGQQQGQAVFHLVDLFLQVEYRGLYLIPGGFHLRHGGLIGQARIHQRPGRRHGFPPRLFGLDGELQLLVEHQQRIIRIGNAGNELGAHGLTIVIALCIKRLGLLLGIAHAAKDVQFPTGRNRQRVGLRGFHAVEAAHRALGCQGKRGQKSQLGREQGGLGFFYAQLGRQVVGVVFQALLDECLQVRVGKELFPVQRAQYGFGGIRRGLPFGRQCGSLFAVKVLGHFGSRLVFGVHAATAQQDSGGRQ